jgi:hypothetical protein
MRRDRFTVAFDETALETMATVAASTNYRDIPDFIRAAVTVMVDLLDATGRKLTIVMRDKATGREWEYSPHEPGRAVPILKVEEMPSLGNVFAFQPRKDEIVLGARACEAASNADPKAILQNKNKRRKNR